MPEAVREAIVRGVEGLASAAGGKTPDERPLEALDASVLSALLAFLWQEARVRKPAEFIEVFAALVPDLTSLFLRWVHSFKTWRLTWADG
jgi:hypothetical protein